MSCGFGASTTHLTIPLSRTFGAAARARGLLRAGKLPAPGSLEAGDFLNYYQVPYEAPKEAGAIGVQAGLGPGVLTSELVLQIAVQPPADFIRPRVALAVVVDTTYSMAGSSFKRAQAAVKALVEGLEVGDQFTLISSKRGAGKPIAIQSADDLGAARALAAALSLDGGEDLAGALADGYEAVDAAAGDGANETVGRVVLISDGAAQETSIDLNLVAGYREQRSIPLVGVGVGEVGSYSPKLIDLATSVGGGANVFLDDDEEVADELLHQRFAELMTAVATDVEVIVTLPDALRFRGLSPEVKSDSPTGLVTATLTPGHTLVFRNTLQTCSMDLVSSRNIDITVRWRRSGSDTFEERTDVGGTGEALFKSSQAEIAKAGVIAAYADGVTNLRAAVLRDVVELAGQAMDLNPSLVKDPALLEIQELAQLNADLIEQPIK
ncbi:Hypothetical protein A7982_03512 [Minicystis rosea]|nr:Hypothetical protein A7982_03512 [Minicystis rosea]